MQIPNLKSGHIFENIPRHDKSNDLNVLFAAFYLSLIQSSWSQYNHLLSKVSIDAVAAAVAAADVLDDFVFLLKNLINIPQNV